MKGHWRWVKSGTTRCDSEHLRERVSADHTACRVAVARSVASLSGVRRVDKSRQTSFSAPRSSQSNSLFAHLSRTSDSEHSRSLAHSPSQTHSLSEQSSVLRFGVFRSLFVVSLFPCFPFSRVPSISPVFRAGLAHSCAQLWAHGQSYNLVLCAFVLCAFVRFRAFRLHCCGFALSCLLFVGGEMPTNPQLTTCKQSSAGQRTAASPLQHCSPATPPHPTPRTN